MINFVEKTLTTDYKNGMWKGWRDNIGLRDGVLVGFIIFSDTVRASLSPSQLQYFQVIWKATLLRFRGGGNDPEANKEQLRQISQVLNARIQDPPYGRSNLCVYVRMLLVHS